MHNSETLLTTREQQLDWLRSQHATREVIEEMVSHSREPKNWQWLLDLARDL